MIFLLLHLRPKGRGRKENPCVERKSRRDRTPSWKQKGWESGRKGRQKRESLLNAASIQRSVSKKFGFRNRAQKQFAQKRGFAAGDPFGQIGWQQQNRDKKEERAPKKRKGVKRSSCTRSRSRAAAAAAAPKFTATIWVRRERACGGPAMPPPSVSELQPPI